MAWARVLLTFNLLLVQQSDAFRKDLPLVPILRQRQPLVVSSSLLPMSSSSGCGGTPSDASVIKLILLDRDGVINQDVGSPGVIDPGQLELTPKAGVAMGDLKRAGNKIAIITNQSCVGKGLITREKLNEIMKRLQEMLLEQDSDAKWDALYVCTTRYDVPDYRCKPSPGMIEEACKDFDVLPQQTVFVGDTLTDMQAATSGGVPIRILVATGYGEGIVKENNPTILQECLSSGQPQHLVVSPLVVGGDGDDDHEDDSKTPNALENVMPLLFVPNLRVACEWILQQQQQQPTVE